MLKFKVYVAFLEDYIFWIINTIRSKKKYLHFVPPTQWKYHQVAIHNLKIKLNGLTCIAMLTSVEASFSVSLY